MKLHDFELSGNCYKIRLFLALTGQTYNSKDVDLMGGEHKSEAFLTLNPKGQVPVLEDEGNTVFDSGAILVYLAEKLGDNRWYPSDLKQRSLVWSWLMTATNEVSRGLADARLVKLFGAGLDYEVAKTKAEAILDVLDGFLANNQWLSGGQNATIADVAVFPYVALAGDADLDIRQWSHVYQWTDRFKSLPGFVGMSGVDLPAVQI